jgi:uncharacterized protein
MTPALMLMLGLVMLGTAFLSGIFGMAGGLILIGILLAIMPLPQAMALHAVTQMASNGWRASLWWHHIRLRPALSYMSGCVLAMLVWSLSRYVPGKALAMFMLGLTPFVARHALPSTLKPNAEKLSHGLAYGAVCMALVLLTGASGPLIDTYFLGGKLERREIVATKSFCQVLSHFMKLIYFGGIVDNAASVDPMMMAIAIAASIVGTTAARRILDAMNDKQFRDWATRIINCVSGYYVLQGSYLLLVPLLVRAP